MDEHTWRSCTDPEALLAQGRNSSWATERRLRLLACACVRRAWPLLTDAGRHAVEVAERFADGSNAVGLHGARQASLNAPLADVPTEVDEPRTLTLEEGARLRVALAAHVAASAQVDCVQVLRHISSALSSTATGSVELALEAEQTFQCRLIRCLFGPLAFRRPEVPDPVRAWNNGLVGNLARAAHDNPILPDGTLDPARLAVLSDAAEEAGLTDADLLNHLRSPGPHARGCFAVDILAGLAVLPHELLAGYEILSELGRGYPGVVYQVREKATDRVFAAKVRMRPAEEEETARFRDLALAEARALGAVNHPNVVRLHEVVEHEGMPALVMEYAEGGLGRSRGTIWPPREAARLVEALARGVHALHLSGVVHRNIKPGNVLLTHDGQPKLAGLTLHWAGGEPPGSIVGTPLYMAPEQITANGNLGTRTDVWALGVVLYELLAGHPPFQATNIMDVLSRVLTEDTPPLRAPRDLEWICRKCLEKDPNRRYASAQELADDLQRYLQGLSLTPTGRGPLRRLWRWLRRD